MKIKIKLYAKMLLLIITTSFVIFGVSIVVISLQIKEKAYNNSIEIAQQIADKNAKKADGVMQEYMSISRAISSFFVSYESIPAETRRTVFSQILTSVLKENPGLLAAWTIWEPNAIDGQDSAYINTPGNTYMGNYSSTFYRDGETIKLEEPSDGPLFQGSYYTIPKEKHKETLLNPYLYSYIGDSTKAILQTNMIVPIIYFGNFLGVIGTDASLEIFKDILRNIEAFDESYAFMISNDGTIVGHPNEKLVGKHISNLSFGKTSHQSILKSIKWSEKLSITETDSITNTETYFYFSPFKVGKSSESWCLALAVPTSQLNKTANKSFALSIVIGLISLFIFGIVIYIISRLITRPIINITKVIEEIAIGNISKDLMLKNTTRDEISEMANSVNKLIEGLNRTAEFAKKIGDGDLDSHYEMLSDNDVLGLSLIEMRESLKRAQELEHEKREQDRKQAWVTQGLARFGEILREDNDNMEKFSVNIAKNLCEYMEIPQCALFIIEQEDEDTYFELKAAFAYGSQKLIDKKVREGEEIVGRAIAEQRTLHFSSIPDRFANITTGQKDEVVPSNLLVVPMLMNGVPYGVLELMSDTPFDDYKVEFGEKIAESIAATVSSVKVNIRTAYLLRQSEEQKDELAQHEEEMRQNLEEMQATQEEANKRENELESIINSLQQSIMMAEFDLEGRIIKINKNMASAYGYTPDQMLGKFQDAFVTSDDSSRREFIKFWNDVVNGVPKKKIHEITKRDQTIYLAETYIPIFENDEINRILNIATNITNKVNLDKEITQLMNKVEELKNM